MASRADFGIYVRPLDELSFGNQAQHVGITLTLSAPPLIEWLVERLEQIPNVGIIMPGHATSILGGNTITPCDIVVAAPNALVDACRLSRRIDQLVEEELNDAGIHGWRPVHTSSLRYGQWVTVDTDRRHRKSVQLLTAIAKAVGLPDIKGNDHTVTYDAPHFGYSYGFKLNMAREDVQEVLARFPAVVEKELDKFYSLKDTPAVYLVRLQGKKRRDAIYAVMVHRFSRKEQQIFLCQLGEQVPGANDALFTDRYNLVVPLTPGQFDDNEIEADMLGFLRRYTRPKNLK